MNIGRGIVSSSTTMLIMRMLEEKDMYGYQMIEELSRRSDDTFHLKAGTLYPLLHSLEEDGYVTANVEISDNGKARRYYHLTERGGAALHEKKAAWERYVQLMQNVMNGGTSVDGV